MKLVEENGMRTFLDVSGESGDLSKLRAIHGGADYGSTVEHFVASEMIRDAWEYSEECRDDPSRYVVSPGEWLPPLPQARYAPFPMPLALPRERVATPVVQPWIDQIHAFAEELNTGSQVHRVVIAAPRSGSRTLHLDDARVAATDKAIHLAAGRVPLGKGKWGQDMHTALGVSIPYYCITRIVCHRESEFFKPLLSKAELRTSGLVQINFTDGWLNREVRFRIEYQDDVPFYEYLTTQFLPYLLDIRQRALYLTDSERDILRSADIAPTRTKAGKKQQKDREDLDLVLHGARALSAPVLDLTS